MAGTLTRRAPVLLTYQDGKVMVTPEDQDIFFISAERATEACKDVIRHEERIKRFTDEVLLPLQQWCEAHKKEISACYMAFPESAVLPVYVIGAREEYDFALTKALSQLASEFEQQGWSIQAAQIPRCSPEDLLGYFNPENALVIYGS
jgi:hypothetical protein